MHLFTLFVVYCMNLKKILWNIEINVLVVVSLVSLEIVQDVLAKIVHVTVVIVNLSILRLLF